MTSPSDNALSLPSGTILNDYRIDEILGKGGFAITYLATDTQLGNQVVLKELLPDGIATRVDGSTVVSQTPDLQDDFRWAVDSFLQEARTLANFEHPNIVRIYRLFEANGTAYIVMPFIQGETLMKTIHRSAPMSYDAVCSILFPLLNGLSKVHQSGVLHRDIKPENIFVTQNQAPVLIDFGAARQVVSSKSMDVTSIITPGYAPIEQYSTDSRYQGAWSDIYAMAAVTHHMITGKKPVPASERNDATRNQQPDPLSSLVQMAPTGYPSAFLAAIDQALCMNESERPRDIAHWDALLGNSNSQTTPSGVYHSPTPQTLHQAPKKSKTLFIIGGGLVALILAIALVVAGVVFFLPDKNTPESPEKTASQGVPYIPPTAKPTPAKPSKPVSKPTAKAAPKAPAQPVSKPAKPQPIPVAKTPTQPSKSPPVAKPPTPVATPATQKKRLPSIYKKKTLKSQLHQAVSMSASKVYLGSYGGKKALYSIQWMGSETLRGSIFLYEQGTEYHLYGTNYQKGILQCEIWSKDRVIGHSQIHKQNNTSNITWAGRLRADPSKNLRFTRSSNREAGDAFNSNYVGHVGNSTIDVSLHWRSDGTVSGQYKSRNTGNTYPLKGDNTVDGFLYLDEYTNNNLSARILLIKKRINGQVIWKGFMSNTDGRQKNMSFQKK